MPINPVSAGLAGAQALFGLYQTLKGRKELKKLDKNRPEGFTITPELQKSYARAEQMAQDGYTPQEEAAFQANLQRQSNAAYNRSFAFGGNTMAGAIQAGLNFQNTAALNQFAANDASLQRQNIRYADQRGDAITQQRNRIAGQELNDYAAQQQMWGQTMQSGINNMFRAADFAGAASMMGADPTGGAAGGSKVGGLGFGSSTDSPWMRSQKKKLFGN